MCPYFLSIGMSYELYWDGDPKATQLFLKADEIRRTRENTLLWLQGLYNYNAIDATASAVMWGINGGKGQKPQGYMESPIPITDMEKERARKEEEERTRQFFMNGGQNG